MHYGSSTDRLLSCCSACCSCSHRCCDCSLVFCFCWKLSYVPCRRCSFVPSLSSSLFLPCSSSFKLSSSSRILNATFDIFILEYIKCSIQESRLRWQETPRDNGSKVCCSLVVYIISLYVTLPNDLTLYLSFYYPYLHSSVRRATYQVFNNIAPLSAETTAAESATVVASIHGGHTHSRFNWLYLSLLSLSFCAVLAWSERRWMCRDRWNATSKSLSPLH